MTKAKMLSMIAVLALDSVPLAAAGELPVAEEVHTFRIPSEDVSSAVRDFKLQSGLDTIGDFNDLKGVRLNAVTGNLTVDAALRRLTVGTRVQYAYIAGQRGISLTLKSPRPAAPPKQRAPSTPVIHPAQDEQSPLLEEIVVTVERTPEKLQTVPASATVYSAADIAARSAKRLADLAQATPNVSMQSEAGNDGGAASSVIYMRGVGTNLVGIGSEGGVGMYLNGVYLGRAQGLNMDLGDVERVEFALGPQGDLYGKNTPGGAINVVTELPSAASDAPSGDVEVTAGSFDRADGLVNVNIPIAEDFAIRFAGAARHEHGYAHRLLDGEPMGDTHENVGRLSALWKPNDAWDVVVTADATRENEHDADFRLTAVSTPALIRLYNKLFSPQYGIQFVPANIYDSYATGPNTLAALLWGASITVIWHEGAFDVKSISAFRRNATTVGVDPDGTPINDLGTMTNIDQNQFSQEVQAHGTSFGDQLTWISGLYYFQESAGEPDFSSVFPALEPTVGDLSFFRLTTIENHQYAGYVHATYALTGRLRLTVGARYTAESKYGSYFKRTGITGVTQNPLTGERANFHSTTPRFGLDYGFTPDLMAYITAAKGFKSGGFNNISLANAYGPENVWTEEAGIHSEWWEHRLRVNVATFLSQYSDIQVSEVYATPGGQSLNVIANAATARIKGGELQITILPAKGLSFSVNGGLTDAMYTSAINTSGGLLPVNAGTPFINVPRWTGDASTQYTIPLVNTGYGLSAHAAFSYRSRVFHDPGVLDTSQAGYGLLNARLSFGPLDEQWQVSAFGTNITNRHYITGGADFSASLGWVTVIEAPPAEWGVNLRYNF